MKQIILVRHGKSSWDYEVSDKDRPLKERGINDTHLVAEKFSSLNENIDFALSSPANRALHTSMIFLRNVGFDFNTFRVTPELYDFSGNSVASVVKDLSDSWNTVIIFGHNYAFTTLANTWGDTYIENVPTAGLVHIAFEVDSWSDIKQGKTKLILFPKHLKH